MRLQLYRPWMWFCALCFLCSLSTVSCPRLSFPLSFSILSRTTEYSVSNYGNYGQSVPIPVPTQIHNYQRMEQNLHFPSQDSSPRSVHTHKQYSTLYPFFHSDFFTLHTLWLHYFLCSFSLPKAIFDGAFHTVWIYLLRNLGTVDINIFFVV